MSPSFVGSLRYIAFTNAVIHYRNIEKKVPDIPPTCNHLLTDIQRSWNEVGYVGQRKLQVTMISPTFFNKR